MPKDDRHLEELLKEMAEEVPERYADRFAAFVELTDAFCDAHLNEEYKGLCRELAFAASQEGAPTLRGKPESWAAGIVCAIGRVNFLHDQSTKPYVSAKDLAKGFGVSVGTMQAKARIFEDALGLMPLHPDWCLPSKLDDNPMVWMLEMDGLLVDARRLPREVQVAAHEMGLIPYVPADRKGAG